MIRMINSACELIDWRYRHRKLGRMQGFTLAELLVAIAIFALLVTIVMGSFNGVFLPTGAMRVQRTHNAMARTCLDRMATDLRNIHLDRPPLFAPQGLTEAPSLYRFAAGTESDDSPFPVLLQLASKAHVAARAPYRDGIAMIRYYLEPGEGDDANIFRLRRADTLLLDDNLPELGDDPILCENVSALQFQYIDAEGEARETWDSTAPGQDYTTPRAVAIRLALAGSSGLDIYETTVSLPVWRDAGNGG